jgi:hypothetical protein
VPEGVRRKPATADAAYAQQFLTTLNDDRGRRTLSAFKPLDDRKVYIEGPCTEEGNQRALSSSLRLPLRPLRLRVKVSASPTENLSNHHFKPKFPHPSTTYKIQPQKPAHPSAKQKPGGRSPTYENP